MFPEHAEETALHALTRDCRSGPIQDHALHLSGYLADIDPANPPDWLNAGAAEALDEHLRLSLPSSNFTACARMSEAYSLFRKQAEPLEAVKRAAYTESLPPDLREGAQP